jgi:hypothetical protein
MKTPTGTAIVEAISQILDRQNREGQAAKKFQAKRVFENFTLEHQLDEKSVTALPRLLRKFDSDDFRQIRSMSDSLIDMDEQELRAELTALKELLKPIEARIHQVKTKTAFVSTVLRPFYAKYTSIWFQERNDIDIEQAKAKIEQLERMKLESVDEFVQWTRDVAVLFEQVVVYRGIDAADPYARPTGTVSEKSSKTYLQAWNAFLDHFHAELWKMAAGGSAPTAFECSVQEYRLQAKPVTRQRTDCATVSDAQARLERGETVCVAGPDMAQLRSRLASFGVVG